MIIGEKLRLLRQSRQIKQTEMADRMGISQQRYSILEKGKTISNSQYEKILLLLKYTAADVEIIFKTLPPPPNNWFIKKLINHFCFNPTIT